MRLTLALWVLVQQARLILELLVDLLDDTGDWGVNVRSGLDGLDGPNGLYDREQRG